MEKTNTKNPAMYRVQPVETTVKSQTFFIPEIPFKAFLGKSVQTRLIRVNTSKVISGSVTWRNYSLSWSSMILLWMKTILFPKLGRHESDIAPLSVTI